MRRPHQSSLLFLAVGLVACEEVDCDTSAAYSVTVSVFDAAGEPYAPEDVTYTVDGSAEGPCDPISDGTEFLCGVEEVGTFVITVYDAGQIAVEETVEVDLDPSGCHVESTFLDVIL